MTAMALSGFADSNRLMCALESGVGERIVMKAATLYPWSGFSSNISRSGAIGRSGEDSFSPARRYTVADTPTWAHPVPTPAGVLVKDESRLALWKLSP
jgi:hypothetical protein